MNIREGLFTLSLVITFTSFGQGTDNEFNWPMYRGEYASGVLDNANIPLSFDIASGKNVKWSCDLPGLGLSSPVVWGDKLFITTAVSSSDTSGIKGGIYGDGAPVSGDFPHDWITYCIDKNSGKILWERVCYSGIPKVKRHPKSTHANCSPATDGTYVVSFFGSEGLYCFNMEGALQWKKDFGKLDAGAFNAEWAEWEFASSPLIHKGVVVVQCDVRGKSFVAAYDLKTGTEKWRRDRDEYPTWCTPNIYTNNGRDIVVVNGYKHRGGYDFITGEEVWKMSGGGDVPIPTPIVGKDLIFFNSAHGNFSPVIAVDKNADGNITLKEGELTSNYVRWSRLYGGSYMGTLLLYNDILYNLNWNGVLHCFDAETGAEIYKVKVGKTRSFAASPVASDGKIYMVDEDGTVYVVKAGKEFEILSENDLGEVSLTVPAMTKGTIFFRTVKGLVAVSYK